MRVSDQAKTSDVVRFNYFVISILNRVYLKSLLKPCVCYNCL